MLLANRGRIAENLNQLALWLMQINVISLPSVAWPSALSTMQALCVSWPGPSHLNHSMAEIHRSLFPYYVLDNRLFFESGLLETQNAVLEIP